MAIQITTIAPEEVASPVPEWLQAICDPERRSIDKPFALTLEGARWICATNGQMAVAIRSDAEAPDGDEVVVSRMREFLSVDTAATIARAELWKAAPPDVPKETCGECRGKGVLTCEDCGGKGKSSECYRCGRDCDCGDCRECDGSGEVGCDCDGGIEKPEPHVFAMGSATFNARLVWRALAHLPGEIVRVAPGASEYEPMLLAADDWRVVVMQSRDREAVRARFNLENGVFALDTGTSDTNSAGAEPAPKPAPLADVPTVPMGPEPARSSDKPIPYTLTEAAADVLALSDATAEALASIRPLADAKPRAGALRIYVAAPKVEVMRARRVAAQLRAIEGVQVMSKWHDVIEEGAQDPAAYADLKRVLDANMADLIPSHIVVALTLKGEGAGVFGEIGRALAWKKRVFWSVERGGTSQDFSDDDVIASPTDDDVIRTIRSLTDWRRVA